MMSGAVGRRYAKALFALAKESAVLPSAADQLNRVAAVASDPNLGPVLRSPLLSAARRAEIAAMLSRELQLSDLLTRFVRLLADQQRLGELPAIATRFQALLVRQQAHEAGQQIGQLQLARQHGGDFGTPRRGQQWAAQHRAEIRIARHRGDAVQLVGSGRQHRRLLGQREQRFRVPTTGGAAHHPTCLMNSATKRC